MAGKPGRSGPPNNANALKPENSHKLLWSRGIDGVLPKDRWVKKPIEDAIRAFSADLPDMSAREREIVTTIGLAKGCELLIIRALHERGLVACTDGHVEVAKASEDLARFMKLKLDGLRLLPVTRRAKLVQSLSSYLKGNVAAAGGNGDNR